MPQDFFDKKGPVGCLLVHGFTGSPNELLELGAFLTAHDVTVSIPTLPGHGTHSADLFNYTWRDWFTRVKEAYEELAAVCPEVFACGLSMGGTLVLHLAAHRPVQGVVSLSAPVVFPAWQVRAVRFLKSVVRYRHKKGGEDVSDSKAKEKLGSYQRYPLTAVEQLFQLVRHVRQDLPEIHQPILILHSTQDHSVSFVNSDIIYNEVGSAQKRKVDLSRSYHVITVDVEKQRVWDEVLAFIVAQSSALKTASNEGSRRKTRRRATSAARISGTAD